MNFYFDAAKTLETLETRKGSIKGVLATLPEKNRKRCSALVIETLKYKAPLMEIIKASDLLKEKKLNLNLALLLVHDMLLAKGIQAGDGPIKQAVLRHKTRLNGELQKLKIKKGVAHTRDLADNGDDRASLIPRYIRVNTSVWSTEAAVKEFISRGYVVGDPTQSKGFAHDEHIPNLLLFHPRATFHEDPLYLSGKIILQDKASCFPAVVLAPPRSEDAVVIDATAAPGNKTSHLSALMGNKGKLYAFERDSKRYKTLQMMTSKAHCKNVETLNQDFLTTDPADGHCSEVTHILLDPSCSGSGIVNRMDHLLAAEQEDDDQEERLAKLAAFQLLMIRHAMKFPSVKRIVYSTCSVHATENENVVREALKTEEASGIFELAPRTMVLPTWHRRGMPEEMDDPAHADCVVRCNPGEDATNGFFVACFVRKGVDEDGRKRSGDSQDAASPNPRPKKKKKKSKKEGGVGDVQ